MFLVNFCCTAYSGCLFGANVIDPNQSTSYQQPDCLKVRIFERSVKAKTVFLSQSAQQQTVVDKYPSREDDKYPSREDVR